MSLEIFQAGLIGVLIGATIVALGFLVHNCITGITNRLAQLEGENEELHQKLDDLIAVKERSRQTGATMAGLEDAMATLINIQYNRDIDNQRIETALSMLQKLRQGPYAYDPETPSGKREEYK
jgi:hypothetical protein